jgi:hypothetical protein
MKKYFYATAEDGRQFRLNNDWTWERHWTEPRLKTVSFRSSHWGDTTDEVKGNEHSNITCDSKNLLVYEVDIAGFSANLSFHFVDNQLALGIYRLTQPHADLNAHLDDFQRLSELLQKKYGQPTSSKEFWFNDLYKDDYSQRGMAVSMGHHAIYTDWKLKETEITIVINGDNLSINPAVFYQSVELGHLFEAKLEQRDGEGL